jgi:hypothetical protein
MEPKTCATGPGSPVAVLLLHVCAAFVDGEMSFRQVWSAKPTFNLSCRLF